MNNGAESRVHVREPSFFLDAVLRYIRLGWPVLPVRAGTKKPWTHRWSETASTDSGIVRAWWQQWPNANIGILTGEDSAFVVLDIDPDKGGDGSLYKLIKQHGALPPSVESLTGGGGRHILFKHPGGRIPNSAGKLGAGLDILGDGGFVVAPPSLHPSGHRYAWVRAPGEIELADLPEWLKVLVTEPEPKRPSGANGKITTGYRSTHLHHWQAPCAGVA